MLLHERDWRQIAKASLLANPVVKNFDVLGNLTYGFVTRGEAAMMNQFGFERPPATFHRRVIPAVPFVTHGDLHAEVAYQSLVGM